MNKFGVLLFAVFLPVLFAIAVQADSPPLPAKGAKSTASTELKHAYFGAGCFWKVQYIFSNAPGVVKTTVGYSGGTIAHPTYEQVCSHATKHVETVQVDYDPKKTSFKQLLEVFWSHHDPTTLNRQGPDVGDQYRSVIFYTDDTQKEEAIAYKKELNDKHRFARPIVTAIEPAAKFYNAEEYHQNYFKKHGQVCE
ncbi:MAG: peptide-methionine (S)-S-oxide reductase [Cyanobacteria bacterium DS2.3.42]|nr:peptide-methionine (S)-S-oxide reductase [Cyanobacteria bacterium DS2.3.42]